MDENIEFDNISIHLTDADLAVIDAASKRQSPLKTTTNSRLKNNVDAPISKYRKSGILSVTDIVAPAWYSYPLLLSYFHHPLTPLAKVQYDYGLRQRRHLRAEQRPNTFIGIKGKEIHVNSSLALANEQRLQEGKRVHKNLERAIYPEKISINVHSPEERWALRIYEFGIGMQAILLNGLTRELPVFGIVRNQVVVGIIDEIRISDFSKFQSQDNRICDDNQITLNTFFSIHKPASQNWSAVNELDQCRTPGKAISLQLFDHKTRRSSFLPSHTDTLPTRLQLMLYKTLLESLLAPADDILNAIFVAAGLDLQLNFTSHFKRGMDAGYSSGSSMETLLKADTLQALGEAWKNTMRRHSFTIENQLQIIYLGPNLKEGQDINEDIALQFALEASLHKQESRDWCALEGENRTRVLVQTATRGSHRVLGIKTFKFSQVTLNAQIDYVLGWWTGKRTAIGVDIENIGRCRQVTRACPQPNLTTQPDLVSMRATVSGGKQRRKKCQEKKIPTRKSVHHKPV